MKKSVWIYIFLFFFILISSYNLSAQDTHVLQIATLAPEGSFWMNQLRAWASEVQRKTRGKVTFVFLPGGIAGEESAVVQKIDYGQLQGAAFAGTGLGVILPKIRIMELPYFYNSAEEWDYVLDHLADEFKKGFDDKGYVLLGWGKAGFAYLFSYDPIRNLEDFRSAKVWVYAGDPMVENCFRELKANGVPIGVTEVVTSLQTGLINCVYTPPYPLILLRWHTHIRYCTDYPIVQVMGGIVITKSAMNKIDERSRAIIISAANKMSEKISQEGRRLNEEADQTLKEKFGVKFIPIDQGWIDESYKFAKNIADNQAGKLYSQELLDRVRSLMKEYQSKNKK